MFTPLAEIFNDVEIIPPILTKNITVTIQSMFGDGDHTGFGEVEVYAVTREFPIKCLCLSTDGRSRMQDLQYH